MNYYPFDEQTCTMEIETWFYTSDKVSISAHRVINYGKAIVVYRHHKIEHGQRRRKMHGILYNIT